MEDISRKIAEERAKLAQKERDYDRVHVECVAQLERLCSELTFIQRKVPEAMQELALPSVTKSQVRINMSYELSDWYYWDRWEEYGPSSPRVQATFVSASYNPLTREWKQGQYVCSRDDIVASFVKYLTGWTVETYPEILRKREAQAAMELSIRQKRLEERRKEREYADFESMIFLGLGIIVILGIWGMIS
jgi:hypothetical protein